MSNPLIIPKLDGWIHIYIDFRDVKITFPKDDFPLLNIDTLVDNTIGHEIFSLMDGFSIYNQIMIAKEDKYKMTFTTPLGTYYY